MADASTRGWGTPNNLKGRIVTIHIGKTALQVNELVAPIFRHFLEGIAHDGFPLDKVADDWGYAKRPVRGYENVRPIKWSNHAWGLAVDINASENPLGSSKTTIPGWVVQRAAFYGLFWGGNYDNRKDNMHFEFLGTPSDAAKIINQLPPMNEDDDLTNAQADTIIALLKEIRDKLTNLDNRESNEERWMAEADKRADIAAGGPRTP